MKIKTEADQGWTGGAIYWTAWDEDSYDGAPGANSPLGHGRTEVEAIADLCDQIQERRERASDAGVTHD